MDEMLLDAVLLLILFLGIILIWWVASVSHDLEVLKVRVHELERWMDTKFKEEWRKFRGLP